MRQLPAELRSRHEERSATAVHGKNMLMSLPFLSATLARFFRPLQQQDLRAQCD